MLEFEIIQVAVGNREKLSHNPSAKEWNDLYAFAERQSLVGVLFGAIEKLQKEQHPDMDLLMDWLGQAEYIKCQNEIINHRCLEVISFFQEYGFRSCVLKGQGVATFYGKRLSQLRQPGDIDLWIDGSWENVLDIVNNTTPNKEFDDKHAHLNIFPDAVVEVHWWPSVSPNPFLRKRLEEYYTQVSQLQWQNKVQLFSGEIINATDSCFDAVYTLLHIYNHFII